MGIKQHGITCIFLRGRKKKKKASSQSTNLEKQFKYLQKSHWIENSIHNQVFFLLIYKRFVFVASMHT